MGSLEGLSVDGKLVGVIDGAREGESEFVNVGSVDGESVLG